MREYHPLASHPLPARGPCALAQPAARRVTLDSPALEVMTDLAVVAAVSIAADAMLTDANRYMMARGVRSLFVLSGEGGVVGLVTATDILSERPLRVSETRGIARRDLKVADVMTPLPALVAIAFEDVRAAKVGHVLASLREASRHHALVAESSPDGGARIRGIFSASEIARQLGEPVQIAEIATTFAEVEQVLAPRS